VDRRKKKNARKKSLAGYSNHAFAALKKSKNRKPPAMNPYVRSENVFQSSTEIHGGKDSKKTTGNSSAVTGMRLVYSKEAPERKNPR